MIVIVRVIAIVGRRSTTIIIVMIIAVIIINGHVILGNTPCPPHPPIHGGMGVCNWKPPTIS